MTGPQHPEAIHTDTNAPAAATATPEPPTARQPLPAPSTPPSPRTEGSRKGWVQAAEVVLAALVLTFAFLVASFVARNADLWLHLATGRLLAHGGYTFGQDPFAYTTAGVYWVNHAWLYDWILYLLYRPGADAWLVVLKALLVAALAGVMLLIRRPGASGWAPAFCTALAVLAMSPRLLLQPTCVSLLLMGVTLWLLWRGRAPAKAGRAFDARLLLLPLFALWVNLDDWFLLGPALVALFWVGDRIQPAAARPEGARPTPLWLLPACLVACLCSPYHVFGFTLPAELYPLPGSGGLLQDVRFQRLAASPWEIGAGFHSPAGANVAGLAYFVLVVLGAASFAADRSALRDWRVLVWTAFALLGAWQVRLIPFFAVVGGPVAALNLQGLRVRFPAGAVFALRAACLAFLVLLIGLAVPGWLYGFNQRARQVAWGVDVDPSLKRAAETLHDWRRRGLLADGERSFPFHPDAACYCAWFCPEEKSFLDTRLPLFLSAAGDYAAICRELDPSLAPAAPDQPQPAQAGRKILRHRGVAVVLLYDPEPARVLSAAAQLYGNHDEWTLLSVDGQALIFGWKPARADAFAALRFDPDRVAFGASGEALEAAPPAPGKGPGRDPKAADWAAHFGRPPAPPWESAAATMFMRLFEDDVTAGRKEAVDRYYLVAAGGFAGLTGLPASGAPGGAAGGVTPLVFRLAALDEALPDIADKPPALPLLAVRAARRAVAADPDDANAYVRLAQAYLALRNETPEHTRGGALTLLGLLRHVQIAAALRQALILNPESEPAHEHLANLFAERQYLDLSLDHRRAQLQLSRRAGPRPGEGADAFKRRIEGLDAEVGQLDKYVQDARDLCEIRFKSMGDDPLAKSQAALDLGLAGKALDDVLMQARVEVYGSEVARRELEMLLLTGRAREAKGMLDDEEMRANKHKLTTYEIPFGGSPNAGAYVFPAYEWLLACAAAAVGDYDQADVALEEIGTRLGQQEQTERGVYERLMLLAAAAEVGETAQPRPAPFALLWGETRDFRNRGFFLHGERADVLTLRAMLDLERGAPAEARGRLEEGMALSPSAKEGGPDAPSAPLARLYLKRLRDAGD